jgi:predicted esterase
MTRNGDAKGARVALALAVLISAGLLAKALLSTGPEPASSLPAPTTTVPPATTAAVAPTTSSAAAPATTAAPATSDSAPTTAPTRPVGLLAGSSCRAVVLVHGGAYVVGDHTLMDTPFAEPLQAHGWRVWNVDYPLLADHPDIPYDPLQPWYPRTDLSAVPPAMREVHERAVTAVVPQVEEALASGCPVTLVGVSAGGSIVLDLAHRYPEVQEAVVVSSSAVAPERLGGAPVVMFYGGLDKTVFPAATLETCDRWKAKGSSCEAQGVWGGGHGDAAVESVALDHLLAET